MATNTKQAEGIYYGWIIVSIGFVAMLVTTGTTMNAFGLYVLPASQEFGLSRASMNTGFILMNAGSAISALILGRLIDKHPARLIMGIGGLALGASLITLGLSHSLWLSAAILSLPMGLGMASIGNLMSPALVARWFTVHRSRALAIAMMGLSTATILVAPPLAMLIDALGWRRSLVVIGLIVAGVVALLLPMVRNAPGPEDRETGAGTVDGVNPATAEPGLSQRQLLARPSFWAIGIGIALIQAIFQALAVSLVPIARGMGLSTPVSASLISVFGLAGISGKVLVATFADRIDRVYALTGLFVAMPLGCFVMLFAHSYPILVVACALIGLASGGSMPVYLALLADRFGASSLGSANGMVVFSISVLGALAVRFAGEVYDRTGGYVVLFYSLTGFGIVAAALIFTVRSGGAHPEPMPAE